MSLGTKNVSYLQARDPSIVSWNIANIRRINLAEEMANTASSSYEGVPPVSTVEEEDDHINVFLRIKGPTLELEYYQIDRNKLLCKIPEGSHSARNLNAGLNMTTTYSFSKIFAPSCKQLEIFNSIIKRKLLDFINGRNSTLLTYGTSGSGKTYTIVGTSEEPGIIPRSLEYIFRSLPDLPAVPELMPLPNGKVVVLKKEKFQFLEQKKLGMLLAASKHKSAHIGAYRLMQERLSTENHAQLDSNDDVSISVWVSFAEVYNETIYDLLDTNCRDKRQRNKLRLGQCQDTVYIRDLTSIHVVNGIEAYQLLEYGLHNLNYASTGLNEHSSRSHGIFTVKLVQYSRIAKTTRISCFNFCDLAGSERLKKTFNVGDRLKESNSINKSLHVLGRCIKGVKTSQKAKSHVVIPFRDSKLTQLFQNALMGNENISIMINLNPSIDMFEESRHALEFSSLSREIIIQEKPVRINNRFSTIIESEREAMAEGGRHGIQNYSDEEMKRMEETIVQLTAELEQIRAERDIEIRQAKEDVRDMYETFITNQAARDKIVKDIEIRRVKERYEEEIQYLKNYISEIQEEEDVINISSSSNESSTIETHSNEEPLQTMRLETVRLNQLLVDQRTDFAEQIEKLKLYNQKLQKSLEEKEAIISDAKQCYLELSKKYDNLLNCTKKAIIENIELHERHTNHGMCYSCSGSSEEETEEEKVEPKVDPKVEPVDSKVEPKLEDQNE